MDRRELIAGAVGLLGTGALSAAARPAVGLLSGQHEALSTHRRMTIRSGDLQVVFDTGTGLPYSYRYQGVKLWGEISGSAAQAVLCMLEPRQYRTVPVQPIFRRSSAGKLRFTFGLYFSNQKAASFDLCYVLHGASMFITMERVQEKKGYELIQLALPELMMVREEDGPAWMAEGRDGGSFVRLQQAKVYEFPDSDFFGPISTELPIGMVGQNGIGCVMEVTAVMDGTKTRISGSPGNRRAILGTIQRHRVNGGGCYGMNDGGPPVCGNAQTPNLFISQGSRSRFDFFACPQQAQPWLTGAKIVRERVPSCPTNFFDDRFLYIVAGKNKVETEPRTTFAQSRELIRDIAMLTDYAPQTVFLSGWAYDGQDTGFPSEDKINVSLGTYEDLRGLMEGGLDLNANVTLNVNYDDAYKSSPLFNEAFVSRRPDGKIWKSRTWDGEASYVVGMAKYMEGSWGSHRINYTMERYRIKDSILIDAMSYFAIRNDWDPRHPASGYKNLMDGKYKIVEEFSKHGVSVTSEQLRYPFVGKLAVTMNGPGTSPCPFGGEAVPLLATVYRGAAIWGGTGSNLVHPQQEIFWNTRSALWFQANTDRSMIADFYYLVVLPFSKLHQLAVEGYESTGTVRRLLLERRSQVTVDTSSSQCYAATVEGIEIARDESTCCPIDENRIAFYSRTARRLRYPLPSGWNPSEVTARVLTLQSRETHLADCLNGMIYVDAPARQPVIVYANDGVISAI